MPPAFCFSRRYDKDKIYSLHESHVECIAKGKAHKRFEYEPKASIARTKDSWIYLSAPALPGNPYDGHTIDVVLKQLKRITGTRPDILIVDRGYRGEKYFGKTQLLTPSWPDTNDTEYKKRKQEIDSEKVLV